ncbi:MAG: DUF1501 domain-containing protein [Planctomycetes bacterium]|nr:DUF1501 domain-containing protein [Planctomycetota bacterium]
MLRFFDRREFLRVSLATASLPSAAQLTNASESSDRVPRGFGSAKSVILVYASGGQSQLETWDPKPNAPLDVRGAFSSIATPSPGVQLCEHLPRLARLADRYTIVRSMSHRDLDHGSATYLALTGRYHARISSNPLPSPTDYPTYGAVLKRLRVTNRFAYEAVHLNAPAYVPFLISPGQDGGFLGREYEPLVVGDPRSSDAVLPGLTPQAGLPAVRMEKRKSLKETLDNYSDRLAGDQKLADMSHLYRQALAMLSSPRYRDAFDLNQESDALRDRYGRHRSGQSCLLARRLVEAGVPFINVIWNHSNRGQDADPTDPDVYGWDTHNDIFDAMKTHLLPRFDESFATLLEDLDERGLLDDTLVVCMGEFGRAPRVALEPNFAGNLPGRKHWASVYSIVLAGAGVNRGAVLGESDRLAAEPITERYGPWDVAATMYSALGIDHAAHYTDAFDRPVATTIGRPMEALYG